VKSTYGTVTLTRVADESGDVQIPINFNWRETHVDGSLGTVSTSTREFEARTHLTSMRRLKIVPQVIGVYFPPTDRNQELDRLAY
jgi:hypothetical protein